MAKQPSGRKGAAKRQTPEAANRALDAALHLAALMEWRRVTLRDIAEEAGLGLDELYRIYPSKTAVVAACMKRVDEAVLAGSGEVMADEPVRDRLFDVVMRRFDVLQPHKQAVASMARDAVLDPVTAACASMHLARSMAWMLEAAGVASTGLRGCVRVKGLAAIYLSTMRVWLKDDSEDLGKTLAALDRNLRRAERLAGFLPGARRPAQPAEPTPEAA